MNCNYCIICEVSRHRNTFTRDEMTKLKDSELLGFTQIRTPFASQGIEKCQIKGCKMLIPLIATTTQTTHYAQRVNRLIQ